MFDKDWTLMWEHQLLHPNPTLSNESQLLAWIRTFGAVSSKTADWFYSTKRDAKDALKSLVDQGNIIKGSLQSSDLKISVYACQPLTDPDECARCLVLERVLDTLLERYPQIEWWNEYLRFNNVIMAVRVLLGTIKPTSPIDRPTLWIGPDWDRLETVIKPGHLATTLDMCGKLVMRHENNKWIPQDLGVVFQCKDAVE